MPRYYRTELVNAIYAAVLNHAPLNATLPERNLLRDSVTGNIRRMRFRRDVSDAPFLQITSGPNDRGRLIGTPTNFGAEGEIIEDASPQCDIKLEFVWSDEQDDPTRDRIETDTMAAVASGITTAVNGIAALDFRRRSTFADVADKRRKVTELIFIFTLELNRADLLP